MHFLTLRTYTGHALSETGAIIAVISIACVVAMTALQTDMSQLMATIRSGVDNRASVAQASSMTAALNAANQGGNTGELNSSGDLAAFTTPNDPLASYAEVMEMVETTGANGATEMLVNNILKMTQDMLASKSIDQQTADQIIALADQGFRIAKIQKAAEDAIKSGYTGGPITFEGETYSDLTSLLSTIGMMYSGPPGAWQTMSGEIPVRDEALAKYGTSAFNTSNWYMGSELNNFMQQVHQLSQLESFKNSPAGTQILNSAKNILNLADSAESAIVYAQGNPAYYQENLVAFYKNTNSPTDITVSPNLVASKETKKEAKNICNEGLGDIVNNDCQ